MSITLNRKQQIDIINNQLYFYSLEDNQTKTIVFFY